MADTTQFFYREGVGDVDQAETFLDSLMEVANGTLAKKGIKKQIAAPATIEILGSHSWLEDYVLTNYALQLVSADFRLGPGYMIETLGLGGFDIGTFDDERFGLYLPEQSLDLNPKLQGISLEWALEQLKSWEGEHGY